jgi:hypothetical protein
MTDTLDRLMSDRDAAQLCLGAEQRRRLAALIARSCGCVIWDGTSDVPALNVVVVVLASATAPRIESLIGSLHENSIVVIPFGENPAFDLLKSKLFAYGSIGSQGSASPHHLWWGGVKPLTVPTGIYRKQDTLFASRCDRQNLTEDKASRLTAALDRLGLSSVIETTAENGRDGSRGSSKIDFIVRQWEETARPIFWIAAEANVRQHPLLPQALGCDFAVHKRRCGELDTGALFFHQTDAARDLLQVWQSLGRSYPDLAEAFLLDQAWTLVASQRSIETAWLPDSYWHTGNLAACDSAVVIQCDPIHAAASVDESVAQRCHRARRFGRHQAPEPHLIMQAPGPTRGPITVLIRDVLASDARNVGAAVEAVARAFAANAGGFARLELVLCAWEDDVESVMQIDDDSWVVVTDPSERLLPGAFTMLDLSVATQTGAAPRRIYATAATGMSGSIFRLADPVLGAKIKRSSKMRPSLVERQPLPH